ncbi:DUF3618 domain-containing protein [Jannaschia marina]|uniref:DUF3618 domain-containing protein n=1 Tax=Jannaschia marina TaxID=2741674 RepID=UPI0015C7F4CE|nr:DUF3618 domain-containing protein [Jannaschia marina]
MTKDQSPDDIERDIEAERAALARSLDALQRQLSPEAMMDQVSSFARENGSELADNAMRKARENPLALALTGAGLAWLIAGPAKRVHAPAPRTAAVGYDDRDYEQVDGLRTEEPSESFEARLARLEQDDFDPAVHAGAMPPRRPKTETSRGEQSLRDRLMEGTEMMTEAARERVIAAREAAIAAERRLEARARDYGHAGREAYDSQPLIGVLVAFGVGALAGALLPRTRTEDAYLGETRDRAVAEAERIYLAEAAKLRAVADAAMAEARATATEAFHEVKREVPTGEAAVDTVEGKARAALDRTAKAAKSEAEKQDLGSSIN